MIEFYTAATPNGMKISIMLAETGLAFREHAVDIGKGDQFKPEFLAISPNNKIPAIVDDEGPDGQPISLFESGAILLYLAEKTGRFLPREARARLEVLQWLFWQMGGFGPMLGQAHHFNVYAPERIEYAMGRYNEEAGRLYNVLDRRLAGREYVCDSYSIADMAIFPWSRSYGRQGQKLEDFPNVQRWFATMSARPAIARVLATWGEPAGQFDAQAWQVLFGSEQYRRR